MITKNICQIHEIGNLYYLYIHFIHFNYRSNDLKRCSGCKFARFCSTSCQVSDIFYLYFLRPPGLSIYLYSLSRVRVNPSANQPVPYPAHSQIWTNTSPNKPVPNLTRPLEIICYYNPHVYTMDLS